MAALTTAAVLREEGKTIHGSDAVADDLEGQDLNRRLNSLQSSALCLSGGGIRSACFSPGVLQALARHPRISFCRSGGVLLSANH